MNLSIKNSFETSEMIFTIFYNCSPSFLLSFMNYLTFFCCSINCDLNDINLSVIDIFFITYYFYYYNKYNFFK